MFAIPGASGLENTSKTIGFIRVWVARDCNPRGQRVEPHIKNNLFYKGLDVKGWQSHGSKGWETHRKPFVLYGLVCPGLLIPGAKGRGNISKTIGFVRVWVSRVVNPRGPRAGTHIKNHWFYKGFGVQGC